MLSGSVTSRTTGTARLAADLDAPRRLRYRVQREVADDDARSRLRRRLGDAAPHAPAGSGDDDRAPFEPHPGQKIG
jgi:hypothetical protein